MKIPTIEQMKIMSNEVSLFLRLGNYFPEYGEIERIFNLSKKLDFKSLINEILSNGYRPFCTEYLSKFYYKKVSSTLRSISLTYGIEYTVGGYYRLTDDAIKVISDEIYIRYFIKWSKIWNTFKETYNPIKPYDMTISEDREEQHKGTTNIDRDSSRITDTETNNKVVSDTTENSVYGFNSGEPVPSDKSVNDSEETFTDDTSVTDNATVKTTHGRGVDENKTITRLGNIGNIPLQELIERERSVWQYQIIDVMMQDMNNILTSHKW